MSDYLLQENGDQILLEDGSGALLLETGIEFFKVDELVIVQPSRWLATVTRTD